MSKEVKVRLTGDGWSSLYDSVDLTGEVVSAKVKSFVSDTWNGDNFQGRYVGLIYKDPSSEYAGELVEEDEVLEKMRDDEQTAVFHDAVEHPQHYTSDPSGVECIQITRHRNFNVGNAIKYLWRNGLKESVGRESKDKQVEDLRKAIFYIEDEIERLENE